MIDTDTAGDDVTSLLFGLLWPGVQLEAITVCAGNVELDLCVRNALLTVEACDRTDVPVFAGSAAPLVRELVTAHYVHGDDGMGDLRPEPPKTQVQEEDAVDALLRLAAEHDDLEIIAQAPLTNIARAVRRDASFARKVRHLWIMGGANNFVGNITPAAEFNFYVDPHAAKEVLAAGFETTIVPWDVCVADGIIHRDELGPFMDLQTRVAEFYLKTQKSAWDFVHHKTGIDGIGHPDSLMIAMVLDRSVLVESVRYFVDVECESPLTLGYSLMDKMDVLTDTIDKGVVVKELLGLDDPTPNAEVVLRADRARFKAMLFELLAKGP